MQKTKTEKKMFLIFRCPTNVSYFAPQNTNNKKLRFIAFPHIAVLFVYNNRRLFIVNFIYK
jgi:hypothetical protein